MKRSISLSLAIAGLLLATAAKPAQSAMISYTADYGSATNPLIVPFGTTLTLNQFDTTKGTLTSVQFILTQTATLTSSVGNFSGQAAQYTTVTASSAVTVTGAGLSTTATSSIGPFSGTDSTLGSFVQVGSGTSGSSNNAFIAPALFSNYEGPGMGTYVLSADGSLGASGSSNRGGVAYTSSATAYGSLEVIYTYTAAIPEPASIGMLALGLGGFAVVRRVRRRAA